MYTSTSLLSYTKIMPKNYFISLPDKKGKYYLTILLYREPKIESIDIFNSFVLTNTLIYSLIFS